MLKSNHRPINPGNVNMHILLIEMGLWLMRKGWCRNDGMCKNCQCDKLVWWYDMSEECSKMLVQKEGVVLYK